MTKPSANRDQQDEAIFRCIAEVCAAGMPSPTYDDFRAAVRAAGMQGIGTGEISQAVTRLRDAGRVVVTGDKCHRTYRVGVGETIARVNVQGWSGLHWSPSVPPLRWPKVTAESSAAYDDAVARREFGRPEHQSGETPGPIQAVRGSYGLHSLTGCSAAMAAA